MLFNPPAGFAGLSALAWLVLAVLLPSLSQARPGEAIAPSQARQGSGPEIRYGGDRDLPPYEFIDSSGRPAGFLIDLIHAIGAEINAPVTVELDAWGSVMLKLSTGEYDLMAMAVDPDRKQIMAFSDPVAVYGWEIFVRDGGRGAASLEDLRGQTVIVKRGSIVQEVITSRKIDVTLVTVDTEPDAIALLASGRHDAAVVSSQTGRTAIAAGGYGIVSTSPQVLVSDRAFAAPLARKDLIERVNQGLAKVRASGEYNRIYERWFGVSGRSAVPMIKVMRIAAWVGIPIAAGIVIMLVWNRTLRVRVKDRTRELEIELAEHRRTENSLREAEARFRVSLEGSEIMVANQDADLRYTWVHNPLKCFGGGSMIGRTDGEMLSAESAAALTEAKKHVMATGTGLTLKLEQGAGLDVREYRLNVEPLRGSDGSIRGVVSAAMDVSELRRAQVTILEMQRKAKNDERLESLGLLAGGIAHDFNNLLTAIMGNAALAMSDLSSDSTAAQRVRAIEETAQSAVEITRQLFTFTGRGSSARREAVRLQQIVEETLRDLAAVLPPGVEIHVEPALPTTNDAALPCGRESSASAPPTTAGQGRQPQTPPVTAVVQADPAPLRQAILNLIQNAVDAVGLKGRVVARIGTIFATDAQIKAAQVSAAEGPGEYAFVEVCDDGPGMDITRAEKLFEPFYTTKPRGKGLGLAVVAGVARRHRGMIHVDSRPGCGTCFRIFFPVAPGVAATI
ncbi:MAG TPA: transporter substrate-binding domain-containing protein [Phycisphaerales bacterium]|nr:transporter substrate-binding domain-containing protein [Phycisphaerales bacterium]